MLIYPSAPYDTLENCEAGRQKFANSFAKRLYINITYAEEYEETEATETLDPVCVVSTTPNKSSKALFEIKCGASTYIGSDPYHFAPDGFSEGDQKKRPYICKNDNTVRGTWTLLGFFPDGACSSIEEDHVFDEATCEQDAIEV